jgi:D-alanyl-lipoteichoic acid acyltransferase DltB (MBOAT superfamily)
MHDTAAIGSARTSVAMFEPPREAGDGAGASMRRVKQFAGILAQLLVLIVVVERFQIENEAFRRLTMLTAAGFSIHYFLPFRHRLPFFVFLSFAAIAMVLGLQQGAWLIGIGLAIIGISHLPIHFLARVFVVLIVGAGLALPRWGIGQVPWSPAVWPLLGSMFVLRLISYFYDRKHYAGPTRLSQTLAYFFLLPNVCFPLFPVIDFKRFCRSYYDEERHKIYQVGIDWIWRGILQLILYRLVYYQITIDSVDVENLGDLAFYMLTTFLLYVRISGHFHLIVGMLHLFGFNLPETHRRYFLASSFTDFWRRINIYWKDFMLKVFYYPAYFRLRSLGETRALVFATAVVFIATWFLHLVQWFWIRGSVFVELNDIIFWSIFAALVLVNSIREATHTRVRTLSARARSLPESAGLVLRTTGTFITICVLWSLWTAESVSDWALMCVNAFKLPPWSAMQFVVLVGAVALGGALAVYGVWKGWGGPSRAIAPGSPGMVLAASVGLCLATAPVVTEHLGRSGEVLDSLRLASAASLNRRDAEQFQRGYYENLLDVNKFNDELWNVYQQMPGDFVRSLFTLGLAQRTGNEQDYELQPLREGRFVGATVRTNRWGMRDQDYAQARPPDSHRFALVGPSTAMGSGVEQNESFEAVLEERLNRENPAGTDTRYEILNFGVAGYSPFHVLSQLQRKVFSFEPQVVLYLGHASDLDRASTRWATMVRRNIAPQDSYLTELLRQTGLRSDTKPNEARRRIRAHTDELLGWVYRRIVDDCRHRQVLPVFVYMETVTELMQPWREADRALVLALARNAGFLVLDLTGAYNGRPPSDLWIRENDGHPNVLGNRLIAERLYALVQTRRRELGLGDAPLADRDVQHLTGSVPRLAASSAR